MKIYTKHESNHDSVKYSNENKHILLYNDKKIDVVNIKTNKKIRLPFHRWIEKNRHKEEINHYSNIHAIFISDIFESVYVIYSNNSNGWGESLYILQHFNLKTNKNNFIDIPFEVYEITRYNVSIFPIEIQGKHFLVVNNNKKDAKTAFINLENNSISIKQYKDKYLFSAQNDILVHYTNANEVNIYDVIYENKQRTILNVNINFNANIFKQQKRIVTVPLYSNQKLSVSNNSVYCSFVANNPKQILLYNLSKDFNIEPDQLNTETYCSNVKFLDEQTLYNTYDLQYKNIIHKYDLNNGRTSLLKMPMMNLPEFKTRIRDYINCPDYSSAIYQDSKHKHIYIESSNLEQ